jgi:nucleotide-binding universal stress UspA family protein
MYKRILVAVDGSKTSQLALRQGIQLAKEQHARLRLVHVVDEVSLNVETPHQLEAFWNAVRKAGARILEKEKARAVRAGIQPETKLLEIQTIGRLVRRVAEFIVQEAERWPADLIVIGTHGRRGISHLFLGSVAEGVVRISTTPVLMVRVAERKAKRAHPRRLRQRDAAG